jgi:hypothetical protein
MEEHKQEGAAGVGGTVQLAGGWGELREGEHYTRPPCTVCGKPYAEHGTFPTCATHPYTSNGKCGHVGIYAGGTFTGVPCAGAECKNGCVAARGVALPRRGQP